MYVSAVFPEHEPVFHGVHDVADAGEDEVRW